MATHFTGRFNRSVGLLVGLALLVGLFVAGPATSQTADPAPDYLASFEACPEDVIPDADFADVPGRHENASDINCIAYYGITKGTSATTYSPDRPVIREHMALFLIRLAELVDIYVPPPSATPFTDIADLSQESRDTISQIYELGITIGTSATTYTPGRNVSRGEMALFLRRLMDQMDVVADGRDLYGYLPDDVDDNDLDADIEAPWRDIDDVPFAENEAVTELYELGVASGFGGSSRLYGPNRDMSRADMAAFMAAILDHSNLRPKGANIQVSPTRGADDFDITVMISVRSDTFAPQEDQAVDWFYTDDPDGGLERNGECDISTILGNGDCQWDDDDDETDRDGNIFVEIRATAGATMTFYAWVGRRNGDDFDDDSVDHSKAAAQSDKGPSSLLITHDVPADAWRTDNREGAWIVDMDRRSSVEFTIQLQDEAGARLEREGVVIDIEVDSREILVDADNVTGNKPDPDYRTLGRDSVDTSTVVTDRRGEATFELDGPSRNERLDEVTIETDCCSETIDIAWSQSDPVLVSAKPSFDLYQTRPSDGMVRFTVEYNLYDQYGNALRGDTTRYTGREEDVTAAPVWRLYTMTGDQYNPGAGTPGLKPESTLSRGRLRFNLETSAPSKESEYFILVKPNICSTSHEAATERCTEGDNAADRIDYADDQVVWVVKPAGRDDFDPLQNDSFISSLDSSLDAVTLEEVELYPADNKFRTFFTLWDYDSGDRFQAGGEDVSLQEFEERWENDVTAIENIDILLYSTSRSGLSFFLIK
ncbi:MAG: S-layer homology domain-containing protein [bacterium]|nr:S-layer homology domain-containing protein [Acidimicrobiia bacterium]MCY4648900.1 S-layer homology domain-containing protein [bacterium]